MYSNKEFENKIISSSIFQQVLKKVEKSNVLYVSGIEPGFRESWLRLIVQESKTQVVCCNKRISGVSWQQLSVLAKDGSRALYIGTLQQLLEKTDGMVSEGQYSILGDKIIFWSKAYEYPIRIDFFDEEIETIKLIDAYSGRTIKELETVVLTNLDNVYVEGYMQFEKVSKCMISFVSKVGKTWSKKDNISFDYTSPQLFFSNKDLFHSQIKDLLNKNYKIFIDFAYPHVTQNEILRTNEELVSGIISHEEKFVIYTKREVYTNLRLKSIGVNKRTKDFYKDIEIGDFLVHEDHGIGIYKGLVEKKVLGNVEQYIELEYASNDKLYIPLTQLDRITKYEGVGNKPKLTRLNSREWQGILKRVRKSVSVVARDLMLIYAGREMTDGFDYIPFIEEESKFDDAFEFEMTPDQERVMEEIFEDMNSTRHMDRLLVGDVGYGKTELAMRAAFRTVLNQKQIAVLVPTTVLASQHLAVFQNRFKDFNVKIEMISRFSSGKENKEKLAKLQNGDVNILIGTHRLLSQDVVFHDLGLVVIDEEQRFGVKQKEVLKNVRLSADVLSLSATPIPRSLYMSLIGLRDISILNTPPKGRKSVITQSTALDWSKVEKWINKEIERGGQVYFLHNNVKTIESIASQLQAILPYARIVVCHAQLPSKVLEKRINEFYQGNYDILVTTTIIQNGIDVPNVNTIIINNADKLGLGQLYQLRGRVGRSKRQAYCYLLYPRQKKYKQEHSDDIEDKDHENDKGLDRIEAILEYQELGSGFNIASKDLELRGAGSILGYSQSGSIEMVGLSLYMQVLNEEIDKLRHMKNLSRKNQTNLQK